MKLLAVIYLLCLSDKPGRRVYDVVVGATSKVGESTWLLARAVLITYCVSAAARRGKQRQPLAPSCRLPSLSEIRYEIQHRVRLPTSLAKREDICHFAEVRSHMLFCLPMNRELNYYILLMLVVFVSQRRTN